MAGTNPMRQSMRTPAMQQGVIAKKAHLDWVHVEEAMRNGEDPMVGQNAYPGGSKDVHHDVMPGDIIIGFKNVRADSNGFNELGIAALNGMDMERYDSHRDAEDDTYFIGIATTEYRVSDPMGDSRAQDPESGFAMVGYGTATTVNNGPHALYPNQFVAYKYPQSKLNQQIRSETDDILFGKENHLARPGQFWGKIQPVLVPFDYTDFGLHYDDAFVRMGLPQSKGGIKDISFQEMMWKRVNRAGDGSRVAGLQEETHGHFWSTVNLILAVCEANPNKTGETLRQEIASLMESPGAANKAAQDAARTLVIDIFKRAYHTSINGASKSVQLPGGVSESYKKLRSLGSILHSGHVLGNWYSKASKVIGKVSELSLPGETANLVLGHAAFI